MILTQEQIDKRLSSEDNIVNKLESHKIELLARPEVIVRDGKNHVGNQGSRNLSEQEKLAVGVLANTVGNELAGELMGVSENTARHLRSAQMTTGDSENRRFGKDMLLQEQINDRLNSAKLSIQERAAEKLLKSMGLITEDKLENCSVKDLASVTKEMSVVMRNMSSNNNSREHSNANVRIIIQQPKQTHESSLDVIEIGVS